MPLLQCHGLTNPRGMADVSLQVWKEQLRYAVDVAAARGAPSLWLGGFSTGATLSVYQAATYAPVAGGLLLFAPALRLAGGLGELTERLLRHPVAGIVDSAHNRVKRDIGRNPFRYSSIDIAGARELSKLIKELEELDAEAWRKIASQPMFVGYSLADDIVDLPAIADILRRHSAARAAVAIPKGLGVPHSNTTLSRAVRAPDGQVLEERNPYFERMLTRLEDFVAGCLTDD